MCWGSTLRPATSLQPRTRPSETPRRRRAHTSAPALPHLADPSRTTTTTRMVRAAAAAGRVWCALLCRCAAYPALRSADEDDEDEEDDDDEEEEDDEEEGEGSGP